MADYSTPTIIRPNIPAEAITMLELIVLTEMYEWERDGDGLYFFAPEGTPTEIQLDVTQVRELAAVAPEGRGSIVPLLLSKLAELDTEEGSFDLDVTDMKDAQIFQDILHRCPDIDHVSIVSGWTCSRMRPDGFGGAVTVITRDRIQSSTTNEMEGQMCALAKYGEIGSAPGTGEHRVLTLSEQIVREMVTDVEQVALAHREHTVNVTDADIRAGCLEAIATTLLAAYGKNLAFSAAQAATRIAWARAG